MRAVVPALTAARPAAGGAHLRIVRPAPPQPDAGIVHLRFNPTEFQLSKANTFAEIPVPGLETPPLQYVRGGAETLKFDALVDTTDTSDDVDSVYVARLRGLMAKTESEHAPPVVEFVWGSTRFRGVVDSLGVTYLLFRADGSPVRARVSVSLKEHRTAAEQRNNPPGSSPTVTKTYAVRRGDTLSSVSQAVYRSPRHWRVLAAANGISDPRRLEPGQLLTVPPLG
ncbi:LysM peptidoglycan-binding domain-containing protein [Streptomyces canus]|uniref:CIS tube protein n=1 Tax=Streptomyces canus TaxID=58343 RepID=UPI0036B34C18